MSAIYQNFFLTYFRLNRYFREKFRTNICFFIFKKTNKTPNNYPLMFKGAARKFSLSYLLCTELRVS